MSGEVKESKDSSVKIKYIRGRPFPHSQIFKEENIIAAMDYCPLDEDIIVCSFPKTGTNWLHNIIWHILHRASSFPTFSEFTYKLVPFIELAGIDAVKNLQKPRVYKHHLPYDLMTVNPKAKLVYIYRRPGDTLVSYYHFMMEAVTTSTLSFEEFFDAFMSGEIAYGDYFDHVLSYHAHKNDANLLLVSYEDLHKDIRGGVLRIAKFLGDHHYEILMEDETLLEKVIEVTSFGFMKKNLKFVTMNEDGVEKEAEFFRKGVIGDGNSLMSSIQCEQLRQRIAEKMGKTEMLDAWS